MDGTIEGATKALLATPLPGYADPKVGDWRAYRHVTTGQLGNFHATAIAVVTAVTPTDVTIELSGRLDETGEQRSDGAELADDARTIDGRTFAYKKISVWLSPDVPAGGEVALREVQATSALTITATSDLIGFGDASHTTWGKRPPGF